MKLRNSFDKILATGSLIILLCGILVFINSININANIIASAYTDVTSRDAKNIPSDIFFIDDDKRSFISYCNAIFKTDSITSIDDSTYRYYGVTNGYRLYRIGVADYPADSINNDQTIGGYVFSSSYLFRPYSLGLYIIGDNGVYTLEEAYNKGIIDISQIYNIYESKN